jgi:hypothetical protein
MRDMKNNQTVAHSSLDQVGLQFDWLCVANGQTTFQVRIERQGRKSAIAFIIDLNRLNRPELERLNIFLVRRSAGLSTQYEVVRHLAWLLEVSLQQSDPQLTRAVRQLKVRELLLTR